MILSVTRTTVLAALTAASLGCTARGGGSSPVMDLDSGAMGPDAPPIGGPTCAELCARAAGAGCDATACVTSCQTLFGRAAGCESELTALTGCGSTATPMCATPDAFPYPGCMAELTAYAQCVARRPADSGVPTDRPATGDPCATARDCASCTAMSSCGWCAGSCRTGTGSGPSVGSCGASAWAWTSSMCGSSGPTDSGVRPDTGASGPISTACQSCVISGCPAPVQSCVTDTVCRVCITEAIGPACAENSAFQAIRECGCELCASECAGLCR